MKRITQPALTLAFTLFVLFASAQAQTPRMTTVNITAASDKVHISAEGDVSEVRVDVADEQGDVVFQSGAITGNALDWKMTDAQGERVAAGTYLVTVTFRTAAGKLRKRVEQVTISEDEKTSTQAAPAPAPNAVQATITGAGTTGRIAKFTGTTTIGNSVIIENSAKIGIGTSAPTSLLHVTNADANNPTITAKNNASAGVAIFGYAPSGFGVVGQSSTRRGMVGVSSTGEGVFGTSGSNTGVLGESSSGNGVEGVSNSSFGVNGFSNSNTGVRGFSTSGFGVAGQSKSSTGVLGLATSTTGVGGQSTSGIGVHGVSNSNIGVLGDSASSLGVRGQSNSGVGVRGLSASNIGVDGDSTSGIGVKGTSDKNDGVVGVSKENAHSGVVGSHTGKGNGVYGESLGGGFAGFFAGKVHATGTITQGSDRNLKANFSTVNPRFILDRLAAIPIQTWNYKSEPEAVRHLGPVAQDFRAAFNLGENDKTIATVDADGVTMAAIQGLYQMMQEKDRQIEQQGDQIKQQSRQIAELVTQVTQLTRIVQKKHSGRRSQGR